MLRTPAVFRDDGTLMPLPDGDGLAVLGASASKAYELTDIADGHFLYHNLGSALGLPLTSYYLELRGYTNTGDIITGIWAVKDSADAAAIYFLDTSAILSGTFILTAIPY